MNTKICPSCKNPIPANAPGGLCPACVLRDADEPAPGGRSAPSLAEVSAAFPQLEVESLIGQGGMGFVYKARQPSLDRTVALKILSPELSRDPAFAERFAREARVLGKLNHPNIVTVFEHGVAQSFYYLLMEYVDGVNLRQAMRAGRFTPPQALAVVPGICDALQAAHAQGVWHRDIKPENILLDAHGPSTGSGQGGVKIADFGIARIVGDPGRDFTLTATGAALGSAAYMAPEQHEKPHDVDHRADIYSLGVVIYEMLTGELPLGRFPAPSQRAAVSARIDDIVFQTLEKERELRQQSAAEVKTDVHRAAKDAGVRSPPSRNDEPAPITKWSIGLALGGIVMFGAASVFTHGSTQGVLLTFAIVAIVLGFIGACIALAKMRRDQILPIWRPGLRALVWSPVVALVIGSITVVLWMVPMRKMEAMNAELAAMAQAEKAKAQAQMQRDIAAKAAAEKLEPVNDQPSAKPRILGQSGVLPKESPESAFRKVNAAANESNGDELRKRGRNLGGDMLETIERLQGEIVTLKATANPNDSSSPAVFTTLRKNDGSLRYVVCIFRPPYNHEGTEWICTGVRAASFRAACRVEFRPDKGDAATILRTHLGSVQAFKSAGGPPQQFDIFGIGNESDEAERNANANTQIVAQSLARLGFGAFFKIIAPAQRPEKPWMAEDEPPFSPANP